MDANELRKKGDADLQRELEARLREQFSLRMQKATGQLGKPHRFKEVRREIARIKTVLTERVRTGEGS